MGLFQRLWMSLLRDLWTRGGEICPSSRNLLFFSQLFLSYLTGERRGVCLFAEQGGEVIGVSLWGEPLHAPPLDLRFKDFANGWGTWIEPEFRGRNASIVLREAMIRALREKGIQVVLGQALEGHEASLGSAMRVGFIPFARTWVLPIKEEGDGY